ncbi:MAG: putative toxin-antitoxin system toxin component, PIN family [Elusimicrobia bacterium]|nr:putative toxin-antitoxin system toxin component, PIN family [Elusimicrobiota bacterium]
MKIVFDTNLFIQGLIFRGDAREILNMVYRRKLQSYGSQGSYSEIRRVVNYDRFKKFLDKEIYTPDKLLVTYRSLVNMVTIPLKYKDLKVVLDDPDDDEFIRIAKATGAKIIISNDRHLKKIKKYEDIRIVEPSIFLKIYPRISGRKIT